MDTILRKHLAEKPQLGEMKIHKELAVVPLFSTEIGGPDYITLKEALAGGGLTISEVSQGGSVPELKVINSSIHNVLMLDGEELAGAKQNRVLNTTMDMVPGECGLCEITDDTQMKLFTAEGLLQSCSC